MILASFLLCLLCQSCIIRLISRFLCRFRVSLLIGTLCCGLGILIGYGLGLLGLLARQFRGKVLSYVTGRILLILGFLGFCSELGLITFRSIILWIIGCRIVLILCAALVIFSQGKVRNYLLFS